uniref:NADH-ubiquinone oxidoreductase chain 2 n=1 Tax=Paraahimia luodianensis TaxID=2726724 RepID=A0A6H1XKY0_9HEMI|nr:NADH dehydrogenase subunit 2 [Paraahimia luodianensis]QJA16294.1 NADH dehydrogenase subunit 2 [Paraahimia luodianensis]
MMNSSKMLFMMTMWLGIIISISSNNWIMIWCGLEITLVSIVPQMINKSNNSSESMMKYFIVQSISSSILMLSLMTMIMSGDYNYSYLMTTALLIKMGVAPFHNWVLTVIEELEHYMIMIILTVNKIAPVTIMSYFNNKLNLIIMLTILTGSIMALNQSSMKKIIGYSSIFNMGFMITALKNSMMWIMYLFVYSILISYLLMYMYLNKIKFINQMIMSEMLVTKMTMWMNMLSMGGMPPLIGFSIKYMIMMYMIKSKMIVTISIMIMASLMVMFFYLRMMFSSFMINSLINKNNLLKINKISSWMLIINLISLPILMISTNFMT